MSAVDKEEKMVLEQIMDHFSSPRDVGAIEARFCMKCGEGLGERKDG